MPRGALYEINGVKVTAPDEEVWTDVVVGVDLNGLEIISPYKRLEWTQQAAAECHLDWFDYENQVLTSLTCRPHGELAEYQRYTDAICQAVSFRQRRGVGSDVIAVFLVNTTSGVF